MMIRRRSLRTDDAGVTAVEFGLIAPVMMLMLCGAIEFGHVLFARMVLEGAIMEAARGASATLETAEADRTTAMRNKIIASMDRFPVAKDREVSIVTTVYADFASTRPENFTDQNGNGRYDPPAGQFGGEPFTDRNQNGVWNAATPKTGTLGGPGDVVSYTVVFPAKLFFDMGMKPIGLSDSITLTATAVTRNEAVVRKSV